MSQFTTPDQTSKLIELGFESLMDAIESLLILTYRLNSAYYDHHQNNRTDHQRMA
jgi:hypothetical protein